MEKVFLDEKDSRVDGYFDVSNTITFIPDKPLYGKINVYFNGIRPATKMASGFGIAASIGFSGFVVKGLSDKINTFQLNQRDLQGCMRCHAV